MTFRSRINRAYDLMVLAPVSLAVMAPYRHRWRALRLIGRAMVPLTKIVGRYRDDTIEVGLITVDECVFHYVLARATQLGMGCEPQLSHDRLDLLDDALERGRPVLVVGLHALLLFLAGRYFVERGCDFTAVRGGLNVEVIGKPGTRYPYLVLGESAALLQLSRQMTPGRVINAMIDGAPPGRRTVAIDVAGIELNIAYPLLQLAAARDAVILFFHPRLIGNEVQLRWGRADDKASTEEIIESFAQFLRDQI